MGDQFEGFPSPTKNFFSMPNEMINIIARIKNMAELKVIIYLIRHTWGFHEYGISKTISVDEFMHGRKRDDGSRMDQGTGLSNHSVIDGLRAAVEHGYLKCDVDTSDLARVKKSYTLKMIGRGELSSPHEDTSYSEDATRRYEDASYLAEDTSHRSEKDTNRKTPKEIQESTLSSPIVDDAPAAITDLQEWKKITDKHKAITLKGHTNGHHPDSNSGLRHHSDGLHDSDGDGSEERRRDAVATDRQRTVEEADATEGQLAQTLSTSGIGTPVQRSEVLPTGSPASLGAAQGGKKGAKNVKDIKPIILTEQEQAFWDLWCNIWFNAGIPQKLNETAYKHVTVLAPEITTAEKLTSLEKHTRESLAQYPKKTLYLGNLVVALPGWRQAQRKEPTQENTLGGYYYFSEAM